MSAWLVKYVLDKIFIFRFRAASTLHDRHTFILYTAMGVVTTLLFWGFEFGFNSAFQDKDMRYVGGLIGLGLGYWAKYHLDKRFVFRRPSLHHEARLVMGPALGPSS